MVTREYLIEFYDRPMGRKSLAEVIEEIEQECFPIEYTYQFFHLRGDYFYESAKKRDRKYVSLGGGFKYNVMSVI